jgi:dihydrolipoamide dehydrogenase
VTGTGGSPTDVEVDVAVLGAGPGGEVVADRLLAAGRRVALVERELVGGECAYWACMPSKTVLRPAEVVAEAEGTPGVAGARATWRAAREQRDAIARHWDDHRQVEGYEQRGAVVLRGEARLTGPGTVEVGDVVLRADEVVVATGSEPTQPDVDGLDQGDVWTNRDTFSTVDLPHRAVVIGGGPVAVETSVFLARFGVAVIMLQRSDRILRREEPELSELAATHLRSVGVDLRTGIEVRRARRRGDAKVLDLTDGCEVTTDVVIAATGRRPRTDGLGLAEAGARLDDGGALVVDEQCRAAPRLWGVGDVTGTMAFTHVAKYQARVVAACLLGTPRTARYDGIPRVVFSDPEVAAVGLTAAEAEEQGLRTASAVVDLPSSIARPWTFERDPRGALGLLADLDRDVLVGAWAVAPHADEWIHQAALAVRCALPIEALLDQVAQFPTYSEGFLVALESLDRSGRA